MAPAAFALACTPDSAPPPTSTVTDSAGIPVVESTSPAEQWTVGAEPVVRIGSLDGPDAFGDVRGAVFLADGRIVVADRQTSQLHVFDADGSPTDSWGGPGEGPGEFGNLWDLSLFRGDSIAVVEILTSEITIFDNEGRFGRSFRRTLPPTNPNEFYTHSCCSFRGTMEDGSVLVSYPDVFPHVGPDPRTNRATLMRMDGVSGQADTLGTFRGGVRGADGGAYLYGPGMRVAGAGSGFYLTEGRAFEVRRFDSAGGLEWIARVHRARTEVTPELLEATYRHAERYRGLPALDSLPSYSSRFLTDPAGNAWAVRAQPSYSTGRELIDVFAPDGRLLAELVIPEDLRIVAVSDSRVAGVALDPYDVEYLHV
ncbi:6-bladed beta-propeller [Gaopeijia maritima]